MFYCYYKADKPTKVLCTCDRMRTHTFSSFLILLFVPFLWFRGHARSAHLLWLCEFYYHFSYRFLFISQELNNENTKVCTKQSEAKQIKTKRFPRQMTWLEKVTLKVLISFQNNLRSKRANMWQWMSIFSKRDIWLFVYFSLSLESFIWFIRFYSTLIEPNKENTRIPVFLYLSLHTLSSIPISISIPIPIPIAVRFNALYRYTY